MRAVSLVIAASAVAFAWGAIGQAFGQESPPVVDEPEKAGQDDADESQDTEPPKTELTEADRAKLAEAREALAVAVDAREAGDLEPAR